MNSFVADFQNSCAILCLSISMVLDNSFSIGHCGISNICGLRNWTHLKNSGEYMN